MRKFFEIYSAKINQLNVLIVLINILLLIKFFNIQVIDNKQYKKIVSEKGLREKIIYGERGRITDTNNNNLAISINKYSFWVNTNKPHSKELISHFFSRTYGKPIEYYQEKLNKKSNYVLLEKNSLYLDCRELLNKMESLKGLRVDTQNKRFYPNNNLACHILGYVDLDGNGMYGIEENFNTILIGDTSKINLHRGSNGQYYKQFNNKDNNSNGLDIGLTINVNHQKILQDEIEKISHQTKANAAHGIIIDPFTGDIIAMAAYPDYNPNKYFNYDIENFRNRCITDSYEPGSTFKIVALSQALESNEYSLNDSIYCERGKVILSNNKFLRDHEPHEFLSLSDIFAYSSNIGTSKMISNLKNIDFYRYCKNFGFGTNTGLPIKSESKGKIRTINNWSKTSKNYMSIGQELSTTSIQISMAYCAIANGGYLLKPNIINKILSNNEIIYERKIKPLRQIIDNETATIILNAMEKTVQYGTAKNMSLKGYKIAGKTGTAQKFIDGEYSPNKFMSSFVSIFPIENPKYVTLITIDSPEYGYHWANESAVPATKEIIKRIMIVDNMENHIDPIILGNNSKLNKSFKNHFNYNQTIFDENGILPKLNIKVPNLRGKTFKEAVRISKREGMSISPESIEGKVVWQSIKPGTYIDNNEVCSIELRK